MYKYIEIAYTDMIHCETITSIKWLACDNRLHIYIADQSICLTSIVIHYMVIYCTKYKMTCFICIKSSQSKSTRAFIHILRDLCYSVMKTIFFHQNYISFTFWKTICHKNCKSLNFSLQIKKNKGVPGHRKICYKMNE